MNLGSILHGTPAWVFVLFAVLVVLGVQALRPRSIASWRLPSVPAVFIGGGLVTLALRAAASPAFVAAWVGAVAMARAPEHLATLLAWDSGVSGLAAGYFVGSLLRLFAQYRSARAAQLQPAI